MAWLGVAETVAVVVGLCVLLPLVWLFVRRRLLDRDGAAVDCSLRRPGDGRRGWALGLARYRGDELEWFRAFSPLLAPAQRFRQGEWTVVSQRQPDAVEAVAIYDDQRVVTLTSRSGEQLELALEPGSLTGFLAWLEAAPPGTARYGGTAD